MLEGEKDVEDLEKATLIELNNAIHHESLRINALDVSIIVFANPLLSILIDIIPFILTKSGLLIIQIAGY